jgi:modulator of FtsH protease HflK
MKFHPKLPGREKIREHLKALRRRLPSSYVTIPILVLAWILSGIYTVAPDELGVVKRFGKLARTSEPGLHYHLPYPVESLSSPRVTEIQRLEFGFRMTAAGLAPQYQPKPDEALMLTGDENIVDLWFIVQFKIQNATDFLFNVADPYQTIRDAAEATMREVVGRDTIDEAMTTGRLDIQAAAQKTLQQILDSYASGLQIITVQLQAVQPPEAVRNAFKEVISAREDKNKTINQAESYASDILPTAKGLAVQTEYEAQAYKEQTIRRAQGDTARFLSLLKEYRKAEDVTRKRLYLEAMEDIVSKARKLVVDSDKQGVLPLLPLPELGQPQPEAPVEKQNLR